MSTPDDDLIQFAIAGHRPAFDLLVKRTSRLVWAHLVLHTRDRTLAEDLVQETYLRAWRSIASLKEAGTFRSWLIAIAERVRIDSYKHAARRKRSTMGGAPGSLDDADEAVTPDASPGDQASSTEQSARALAAMRELPEQYQQALSLRYLAGADYDEMSRQLALTNGSLRGVLHRGLEMLREKLKDE